MLTISADEHILEPYDLWVEGVPAHLQKDAPFLFDDDAGMPCLSVEGKTKVFELGVKYGLFGHLTQTTMTPQERLAAMDEDGIDGAVLYPGWSMVLYGIQNPELHREVLRAYNRWLAEFSSAAPERLLGIGLLPVPDVAASLQMLDEAKSLGLRGVSIPAKRTGLFYNDPEYDPLWDGIEASGLPLSMHAPLILEHRGIGALPANFIASTGIFRSTLALFMFSGILDKRPNLKLVLVEGGISWIPQTLVEMDFLCETFATLAGPQLSVRPSEIWRRQCWATFQDERAGIRLLDMIGAENVMWGSDFPHPEGTFPNTRQVVESYRMELPEDAAAAVFGGNAARLWLRTPD